VKRKTASAGADRLIGDVGGNGGGPGRVATKPDPSSSFCEQHGAEKAGAPVFVTPAAASHRKTNQMAIIDRPPAQQLALSPFFMALYI